MIPTPRLPATSAAPTHLGISPRTPADFDGALAEHAGRAAALRERGAPTLTIQLFTIIIHPPSPPSFTSPTPAAPPSTSFTV